MRNTLAAGRNPWVLAAVAAALGLAARIPFFPHVTGDYQNYVRLWAGHLESHGFAGLGDAFSNYTPPYLYLLWLAVQLPLSTLFAVKTVSVAFDLALALAAAALVFERGGSRWRPAVAFSAVFLAPTVVLNSAAWGQCDSIYAFFVVAAVGLHRRDRPWLAMLSLGTALAFKAQAVFILPFVLLLTLRRDLPLRTWAVIPLPYLVAIVPPYLLGRPLPELLTIYRDQAETYRALTLNAPTLWAWLDVRQGYGAPGIVLAGVVVPAAIVALWRWSILGANRGAGTGPRAGNLPAADALAAATFLSALSPFLLPRMHDRYFFIADVLAIALAVVRPSRWYIPVLIVSASLASYMPFLFGVSPVPLELAAALMLAALLLLADGLFPQFRAAASEGFAWLRTTPLLRFAAVGAISTALFVVLYPVLRTHLEPLPANAVALSLTMVFNFLANRSWTFRARRRSIFREAPLYLGIYLAGLVFATLTLQALLTVIESPSPALETFLALASGATATATRYALLTLFLYTPVRARPDPA